MGARYKPSQVYPTQFPGGEAITLDPSAFDDAIRSQGLLFEHHQALPCPVGRIDKHDSLRRPHPHHVGCQNGFLYAKVGRFQALLTSNAANLDFQAQGLADASSAQCTAPRFYACDDPSAPQARVYLNQMDKLYFADERILVPHWEFVEAGPDGKDRLAFPAICVTRLVDNRNVSYSEGSDFNVLGGNIVWAGNNQPGIDPETEKGRIYAVWYLYRPWWYVKSLGHEIRVTNVDNPMTGERSAEKMPQSCTVVREYFYLNKENEDPESDDPRQVRGPEDGSFPPR